MKLTALKTFILSIAIALALALSPTMSTAQEEQPGGPVIPRKKPKKTEQQAQQGVVKRVIDKTVPGGYEGYVTATQNPAARPNYREPANYQNPVLRRLEFGNSETMNEARRWLDNPSHPDRPASGRADISVPIGRQSNFFSGKSYVAPTREDAQNVMKEFKSVPTGMVVDGKALGMNSLNDVQYDPVLNALVLDGKALYFSPIPPQSLAALCRALAQNDNRVGVALGRVQIVYGKITHDSLVAIDLKLADNFLGNIAFAQTDWLPKGYPLAKGYTPLRDDASGDIAVMFKFTGFRFGVEDEVLRVKNGNFEVRLIPLGKERAPDGGAVPDYNAISQGLVSRQYEANANHVVQNIDYYRRERFVDNAFRYGEVAALLRFLKSDEVDLAELARVIEQTTGVGRPELGPAVADMQRPIDNLFDAWRRLDLSSYLAQWAPNAVQYNRNKRTGQTYTMGVADLRQSREAVFAALDGVGASHVSIYRGFRNGVGYFDNSYRLVYRAKTGKTYNESGCEAYKVRREAGRWVIMENQDDKPSC